MAIAVPGVFAKLDLSQVAQIVQTFRAQVVKLVAVQMPENTTIFLR